MYESVVVMKRGGWITQMVAISDTIEDRCNIIPNASGQQVVENRSEECDKQEMFYDGGLVGTREEETRLMIIQGRLGWPARMKVMPVT